MFQIFDNALSPKENQLPRLKNAAAAFSDVTGIPITFFDMSCAANWQHLKNNKPCAIFPNNSACAPGCKTALISACHTAFQLGEAYLFICEAGLVNIAFPYREEKAPAGCFIAGPFAMGSNKNSAIKQLSRKLPMDKPYQADIIAFFSDLTVRTPKEVQSIYELFQHALLGGMASIGKFSGMPQGYVHLDDMTQEGQPIEDYPYELESFLLDAVKSGNVPDAIRCFEEFFNALCVLEHGNVVFIRVKLMELCGILSRVVSRAESHGANSFSYLECLDELSNSSAYSKIHDLVQGLIIKFTEGISLNTYGGASDIVKKALRYINEKYKEDITLESTAKEVHANPSYLSTLFKKETGVPFSGYLVEFRLQKCRSLLSETNLNFTTICFMTGFNNQSYFAKVFKNHMKMTPGEYRRSHQFNNL